MNTRQEFLAYVAGLRAPEVSVAVALGELLRRAGPGGCADRGEWLASVRERYQLLATRSEGGGFPMVSPEGEALGGYLEQQVLDRLEEAGVARRRPAGEMWEQLCFTPEVWEVVAPERGTYTEEVDRIVGELQGGRGARPTASATAPPDGSRLWAEGLTKAYKRRKVVNGVDLDVRQGETVGLLGPNGAGKTTTFYMIVGLIAPAEGRVHLDDHDITETPMYRRARMGVGYLAQEPSVFRKLTVEENVRAILETLKLPRKEEKARLEELLQELSIAHLRDNRAYSLSGGERRRLEITRALVQRPKFMLLDEPFAGIDPIAVNDIQQIVAELRTRGIGTVISDHNVEQTLEIVDRAYIMYEGRIRVSGTVSELVWNDEVAEIYLGPVLTARMRERYAPPEPTTIA